MTALAWTLLTLVPLLVVIAFLAGARFERDRWLEALWRKAEHAKGPEAFCIELGHLVEQVKSGGWSDAP